MKTFFQKFIALFLVYQDEKMQDAPKRVHASFAKYLATSRDGLQSLILLATSLGSYTAWLAHDLQWLTPISVLLAWLGCFNLAVCRRTWRRLLEKRLQAHADYRHDPAVIARHAPEFNWIGASMLFTLVFSCGALFNWWFTHDHHADRVPDPNQGARYAQGEACHRADIGSIIACPGSGKILCERIIQYCDPATGRATACTVEHLSCTSKSPRLPLHQMCVTDENRIGIRVTTTSGDWSPCREVRDCASDPRVGAVCVVGQGACESRGAYVCEDEVIRCDAIPSTPSVEVCDNADNDCDGAVDEYVYQACYPSPRGLPGVGICRHGRQTCSAGVWSDECDGAVTPRTEICGNDQDDDCDGVVDSDLECPR